MKIKILLIIFFLSLNFNLYANELVEESKIHKNLRCLVCQGQSIADSNSDFALTLKMVVKDLIDQGKTEAEIYSFLSDKYGDWILFNTPIKKNSYFLWFVPYVLFIFGGVFLYLLIRKRTEKTK